MTSDEIDLFSQTIAHFQKIARENRFPENGMIEHDVERCVICHPELLPLDAFAIYLEVVTRSVEVRRPRLDQSLVDEINNDLILVGSASRVSLNALRTGEDSAVQLWREWLQGALATGLELLSIHSATSREFDLEEAQAAGHAELIRRKIDEVMAHQRGYASP